MAKIKKLSKKFLSVLVILALVISSVGVAFADDACYGNTNAFLASISEEEILSKTSQVERLLMVAMAQEGKSGSALGYSASWCTFFVSDCARIAGISEDIIPNESIVSNMYNSILASGGEKVDSSETQLGDIVFYYCNSHKNYMHVGIVYNSNYSIDGNYGSLCTYHKIKNYSDGSHSVSKGQIELHCLRPAYGDVEEKHVHSYAPYVTAPTCTEKGFTTFFCACGDMNTDLYINATGHDYQNIANTPADCVNPGQKLYCCSGCFDSYVEATPAKGHSSPVWTVSSSATCTESGESVGLCSDCGAVLDTKAIPSAGHKSTYIKVESEPTADTAGIKSERCTDCDAVIKTFKFSAHTHTVGYEMVIRPATCTENGVKGIFCAECNACYNTEEISADGHGDTVTVTTKSPTCTQAGKATDYCTVCGIALATNEIEPLGHSKGVWTTSDDATCTQAGEKVCSCIYCGKIVATETIESEGHGDTYRKINYDINPHGLATIAECCSKCHEILDTTFLMPHDHSFGYELTLVQPTCLNDGEKGIFCSECNACYDTEVIPATGHDESVWTTATSASCTASCEKHGTCLDCGEIVSVEKADALGHDEGVWVISIPATCTTAGEETRVCTRCKSVIETRELPALNHDEGVRTVSIKPTCTENGEEILSCTACGETIDSKVIAATGHDDGVWRVDFEATPEHDGQMSRYCSLCNEVLESKAFEMHEHTEGYRKTVISPTCTNDGEGGIFCQTCGVKYETYVIPALGHLLSEWYMNNDKTHSRTCSRCHYNERNNCEFTSTVTEPTCTEGGYTVHICDICSFTYTDAYTDPLGHDWSKWTEDAGNNTHSRVCLREGCGACETAAHVWSEWIYENESHNAFIRYCPDCGATERKEKDCDLCLPLLLVIGGIAVGSVAVAGAASAWNAAIATVAVTGGIVGITAFSKHILPELQKLHSVTYMVNGKEYRYYLVKEGSDIPVPDDPEIPNGKFDGWEPEIPEAMPDHDLVFDAKIKGLKAEAENEADAEINTVIPDTGSSASKFIATSVTTCLALATLVIFKKKKEG